MRLLPKNSALGWTPYAWLVYLAFLFVHPVISKAPRDWAIAIGSVLCFLPLYFRGYWVQGVRLLPYVAAITLLGLVVAPLNAGGAGFFIYAAAFAGRLGRPAIAVRYLAAIVAVLALEAWFVGIPYYGWIWGLAFSTLIGGVNIHFFEAERAHQRLALAHEEVERLATLAERERIARDLHDLLGHTLSLITLKAELAAKLLDSDGQRAREEVREIERISRGALKEVRSTVHGYQQAHLAGELARSKVALGSANVDVAWDVGPYTLEPEVENAVALALRESVTNILRHAQAENCQISLAQTNGHLRLDIEDNGKGSVSGPGSGVAGMRRRIEEVGGKLEWTSDRGTKVSIEVPASTRDLDRTEAPTE